MTDRDGEFFSAERKVTLPRDVAELRQNGTNNVGNAVGSGVYFYRLEASAFIHTRKRCYSSKAADW